MPKFEDMNCILLIDDDAATNFINQLVIEELDIDTHIQVCNRGQIALDYLTCSGEFKSESEYPQPGIIFLDINMPGMDGWEFIEKYNNLPEEQKGKIVVAMLTTSENPDDLKKSKDIADVKMHLKKPLEKKYVLELVRNNFKEIK